MNIQLNDRGILEITGQDRLKFLQGLVTNDVYKLEEKKILYAALLTPQGKYLYDFFLIHHSHCVWIDVALSQINGVKQRLSLYKLRSDINIKDDSQNVFIGCLDHPQNELSFEDPRFPALGFRCYKADPWDLPLDQGLYQLKCLEWGIPSPEDMIPEKGTPLECGLQDLHAISWDKGCYMGQELTARTKYRGLVRKRLFPILFEGDILPFGAPIYLFQDPATEVGQIRTSSQGRAIAMLRLEFMDIFLKENLALVCEGIELKVIQPAWMKLDAVL